MTSHQSTRRDFLKVAAGAGAAVTAGLSITRSAHAAGSGVIKVGLIGSGSRGLGAAIQALNTGRDVKLVAIGDYFKLRASDGLQAIRGEYPEQVEVPEDRIFDGFENAQGVINSGADVILIACVAKLHPYYTKLALEAGKHVFVEKPNAIDSAGVHVVEENIALAREKNLCHLSGLHSRFCPQYQALVEKIHDGAIGEVKAIQSTFLRSPYGVRGYPEGMSELDLQIYNQYMFSWLSGDDFVQSLVHNVDRMTWLLGGRKPIQAFGMGGRASMTAREFGNVFDHHAGVFIYPEDKCRLYAYCRTETGCYDSYDDVIFGTKGVAYWNEAKIVGETNWKYQGAYLGGHQEEQTALFDGIRNGKRIHSDGHIADSTMMGILGQMACYTGKMVTWKELYDSKFVHQPAPDQCVAGMAPPVVPGPNGSYPVPIPGQQTWW